MRALLDEDEEDELVVEAQKLLLELELSALLEVVDAADELDELVLLSSLDVVELELLDELVLLLLEEATITSP